MDWWPGPRFDGPSVFNRLLDPDAGHCVVAIAGARETTRRYLEDSMVLETTMRSADGVARLTDCLAFPHGARGHDIGADDASTLVRVVEVDAGAVTVEVELRPRPEYGLAVPVLERRDGAIVTVGGSERLFIHGTHELRIEDRRACGSFVLRAGERLGLVLVRRDGMSAQDAGRRDPFAAVADTHEGWRSWSRDHRARDGEDAAAIQRSLLVLQALTYQPSGALVAAPTTSLPERVGGTANWDYRFGWLRDGAMTARALSRSQCGSEPLRFFSWMTRAALTCMHDDHVQIVFGLEGERTLAEHELDHLRGFADSRPVRVGNDAWRQVQLDVLGEVVDVAYQLRDRAADWESVAPGFLRRLIDRAADEWMRPDAGIWEGREGERRYTSSRVQCWVALDRGVRMASLLDAEDRREAWARARDAVRAAVLEHGFSEQRGAFTGAFGSDDLDVSVLLIPLVGFLPADDPRVLSTIDVLERELGDGGLLRRWSGAEDGAFLLASFWLAEALALAGRVERARAVFDRAAGCANDLGLLAEEVDPQSGRLLGNFPQGLSHMGLINAATALGADGDIDA